VLNTKKIEELYTVYAQRFDDTGHIPVFGEGSMRAGVMLVGEAPGARETELRKPFVGKAGQNLDEFLALLEMGRGDIFITNVVKFRPYKVNEKTGRKSNRPPTREEIALCAGLLSEEIAILDPRIIVTLGNTALRAVLGDQRAVIGDYHGKMTPLGARNLFALYHPASIIYNRSLVDTYREDVLELRRLLAE